MDIPGQCRRQAEWCENLGSPLYAALLRHVADDYESHGPAHALLAPHAADTPASALALRLMGAVHRLVLAGAAPELTPFYPSVGGRVGIEGAWKAFRVLLFLRRAELAPLLHSPVQTNDVGRSGTLLGGFLHSAVYFGKPLRLLEIGTSAGLNLLWDRYRYEWSHGQGWGPPDALVRLRNVFRNEPPQWPVRVDIVERAGCDLHPLDATSSSGQRTLLSYIWADQLTRIERLKAACDTARDEPVAVEQATAGEWLERKLAERVSGATTVVFHSVVWQYLSLEERSRVEQLIRQAGAAAKENAPLVWLRMEPLETGLGAPVLRWQGFPGGEDRTLATSSYHAPSVCWL